MAKGYFLYRDDKTTCGGSIIEGFKDHRRFGRPQACELHKVTCGKSPGVFTIVGGLPQDKIHGRKMAGTLHSFSSCPCRATFLASVKTDPYWLVSEGGAAEEESQPLTAENRLAMVDTTRAIIPVFTKSCTKAAGCTDAGKSEEPAVNFGPFVAFINNAMSCCEHDNCHCETSGTAQIAQSTRRPARSVVLEEDNQDSSPSWSSVAVLGATRFVPIAATAGGTAAGIEAGFLLNPVTVAAGVILGSIFYSPMAGEGSDRVPNIILPEEYWHNEELRRMAATGQMATTRVRFFFGTDNDGKTRVYGVHTGEGTPYEGVRTGEMKWSAENRRFEFSPHPGQEPLITWTPADGPKFPTSTASPIQKIDQPTILVTPIPEHGETTTPPFPVPEPQNINDWILTFPADSGVAPIYVLLKTPRDEPGVASGKGEVLTDQGQWLEEAGKGLGAPVPVQVADKLRGRKFSDFDDYREAFWLAVADCPELLTQFSKSNQTLIKGGNAPYPVTSEQVGGRQTFELHHIEEIQYGGAVMDADNLKVTTPKLHIEIHSKVKGNDIKRKI